MPLVITCPAHPEHRMDNQTDAVDHARMEHPGERAQTVVDSYHRTVISQAHAQGNANRHISRCNACARTFEVSVGAGGVDHVPTKCEECR